jgi:uncharacterized membrane protein YraQ (UPF0718 family)
MALEIQSRTAYDLPTAVTFLLFGVALGSFLSVLFSPAKSRSALSATASR